MLAAPGASSRTDFSPSTPSHFSPPPLCLQERKANSFSCNAAEKHFPAPSTLYIDMYIFFSLLRTPAVCMERRALHCLCKRERQSIAVVANTQLEKWNVVKVRFH